MRFTTAGCRPVIADSKSEAVGIFAARLARRKYGRRAYARTLNVNSWSQDGRTTEYQAFVGVRTGRNETTGSNIYFTVTTHHEHTN